MIGIIFKPQLYQFHACKDFAEAFMLNEADLILTNEYIFAPCFGALHLPVHTIFQEQYGMGEPTDLMVDAILEDASKIEFKRIIAIGGGTVIDIAKTLAIARHETVDELYDKASGLKKAHELVIVPTTCGTGSEMTNISIINRTRMGTKMGLVSASMYADQAVLIPELLDKLPFAVFAASSIDALVHAVESALSPKATSYTKLFSYKAVEMIIKGYRKIAAEGRQARIPLLEDFLVASNYAGIAFGTAGCAAVHALSYPLGGAYHVPHGESNYALFTGVLKNYMEIKSDGEIAVMNNFLSELLNCSTGIVYERIEELLNQILPKKALHEYGVTKEDLQTFTDNVMETQGRLMGNNFVPLDAKRVYKIYSGLY